MSFIAHLKDEAKQNFIQHKMKLNITQQQHMWFVLYQLWMHCMNPTRPSSQTSNYSNKTLTRYIEINGYIDRQRHKYFGRPHS